MKYIPVTIFTHDTEHFGCSVVFAAVCAIFFAVAIPCVLLFSCTDCIQAEAETSVKFEMPLWPKELSSPDYWLVTCLCADGTEKKEFSSGIKYITFDLPKNITAAITAQPITDNRKFFRPAGCIYPGNTRLSWQDGFAADILKTLYTNADGEKSSGTAEFLSHYNWKRFTDTIRDRESASITDQQESDDSSYVSFYNPWNLDREKILSDIAGKFFSVADLNMSTCITVALNDIPNDCSEISQFIPMYIPENEILSSTKTVTLLKPTDEPELFLTQTGEVVAVSVSKSGEISLVRTALPIYTGKNETLDFP